MPPAPSVSNAGIATTEDGHRTIPSSVRADGSIRKEIKVRPGFRPAEDVELYKNRTAAAFRTGRSGSKSGVPGAELVSPSKPAAKKAASKKEAVNGSAQSNKAASTVANGAKQEPDIIAPTEDKKEPVDPAVEAEKEAKKLAKKLRQAKDLQRKQKEGGGLLPEQLQKVVQMSELMRRLEAMGFDAEGVRKTPPPPPSGKCTGYLSFVRRA